jgi:hypothetical protein
MHVPRWGLWGLTLPIPEWACPIFTTTGYVVLLSWWEQRQKRRGMVRAAVLPTKGGRFSVAHSNMHHLRSHFAERQATDRQTAVRSHTAPLSPESNPEPCLPVLFSIP